jgi:hypothetical protein
MPVLSFHRFLGSPNGLLHQVCSVNAKNGKARYYGLLSLLARLFRIVTTPGAESFPACKIRHSLLSRLRQRVHDPADPGMQTLSCPSQAPYKQQRPSDELGRFVVVKEHEKDVQLLLWSLKAAFKPFVKRRYHDQREQCRCEQSPHHNNRQRVLNF